MSRVHRSLVVVCLLAASAGAAHAQTAPAQVGADGVETARFHFGPVALTPSIALSDVGVDNNVFNDPVDPKSDSTAAFGPAADFWVHLGPSRVKVRSSAQYLYYNKYNNQRSWNTHNEGRWDLPLGRMTPFLLGAYANTRQRPGYEIDSRAHQRASNVGAGTSVRLSGKTAVIFTASSATVAFDRDEQFLGADLAAALNRRTTREELQFQNQLTPLTTFVIKTDSAQDRFDSDALRNTNSLRVTPGFEFKPLALISGSAYVGVRRFDVLSGAVDDYNGLVASVDVRYTIARTLLQLRSGRDLEYSFEPLQPYYAVTDTGVTLTERITSAWDVVGRAALQRLAYRNLAGAVDLPKRVDRGSSVGGGAGYRVGDTLRLGADINYYRRDAPDATTDRDFHGLRVSGSISYGLQ
jgi:hypothetical protein